MRTIALILFCALFLAACGGSTSQETSAAATATLAVAPATSAPQAAQQSSATAEPVLDSPASGTPASPATSATLVPKATLPAFVVTAEYRPAPPILPYFTSQMGYGHNSKLLADSDTLWNATNIGVFEWNLADPSVTFYGSEHGVAFGKGENGEVRGIAKGGDGSLWITTEQGIVRRHPDGSWHYYGSPLPDMPDTIAGLCCAGVAAAGDGSLWFAWPHSGLIRWLPEDKWTQFGSDGGVLGEARALASAPDGSLLVRTENSLLRLTNLAAEPEIESVAEGLESGSGPILGTADGSVWYAGEYYVGVVRPDGTRTLFGAEQGYTGEDAVALVAANDGSVLVLQDSDGGDPISKIAPDGLVQGIDHFGDIQIYPFEDLTAAPDGSLLGAHGPNIVRLAPDGRGWSYWTGGFSLPEDDEALAVAPDGTVWATSTCRSPSYLAPGGTWESVSASSAVGDIPLESARALAVGPDGAVWIGCETIVLRYTPNGEVRIFSAGDGLDIDTVMALEIGSDGVVWVGSQHGTYTIAPDGSVTQVQDPAVTDPQLQQQLRPHDIAETADGTHWFAGYTPGTESHRALMQRPPGGEMRYLTPGVELALGDVGSVAVAPDDSVWVLDSKSRGTAPNAAHIEPGGNIAYVQLGPVEDAPAKRPYLPDTPVLDALTVAPDGTIWFGNSNRGLCHVFGDGTWRCFGERDGLPSNSIRRIVPAPDGSLWIGTDAGVSRLSPEGAAQR